MLEADREMYVAFAREIDLDFQWISDLIDGLHQARPDQALRLSEKTATKQSLWTQTGKAKERLIAVKVWWLKMGKLPLDQV